MQGWLVLFEKASMAASDVAAAQATVAPRNVAAINARALAAFASALDSVGDHYVAIGLYEQAVDAADTELRRLLSTGGRE